MRRVLIFLTITSIQTAVASSIKHGEVKILYPCEILEILPRQEEVTEEITFYEKGQNELYSKGLILRKRVRESEQDLTLKSRPIFQKPELNEAIYKQLEKSDEGELDCEADVTYNTRAPEINYSCSFKSTTKELIKEHFDFLKMLEIVNIDLSQGLKDLREVKVTATEWKFLLTDKEKEISPLAKAPSIERWIFKDQCLLEVSAKFKANSNSELKSKARDSMDFLRKLVPAGPSKEQGSKTSKVLLDKVPADLSKILSH